MARIIVTGGSGFLGKHLLRAMRDAGHQIVKNIDLRDNPEFPTVIADVQDAELMKKEIRDADAVFHLASLIEAGESVKFPQRFVDFNVSGSVSVLEAMKENKVPIIAFSSSAAIYGEPTRTPILEDDRTLPMSPYGMTKLAMEALASSYVATAGMTGIALRYFNLYGPGEQHQPETHAIPRFIQQIRTGQEVTVWGEGQHLRDFIYISDVVNAHITALDLALREPNKYHYMNISTNKPNSVAEVISTLEELIGKKANRKFFPPRPGDPLVLTADASKAKQIMGWEAQVGLKEGLQKTVEYFLDPTTPTPAI
jgi:nucleoside-diphosphate-sugar epimerase